MCLPYSFLDRGAAFAPQWQPSAAYAVDGFFVNLLVGNGVTANHRGGLGAGRCVDLYLGAVGGRLVVGRAVGSAGKVFESGHGLLL